MTSKERMICALERKQPDRLPVTTHHLMHSLLQKMGGISNREFFDRFGMDAIQWMVPLKPNAGERQSPLGIESDNWRIVGEEIPNQEYFTRRYRFLTPKGELTQVMQFNQYTMWVTEHLIKEKKDIALLGEFMTSPLCDIEQVNQAAAEFGDRGIVRGHILCADVFGQPGCWQDAACLYGIEKLIMESYDDPDWVHEFLGILQRRKLTFVESFKGAAYDVIEFGGGDASSTVISPAVFDKFVAPYDAPIIEATQRAGMRLVYHTCGGMMPLLERLAGMGPDAIETLTPVGMGGDTSLAEAKRRVGDKVCLIGGFDQLHFFTGCTPDQTRAEVRRCFAEAGPGGGFILSPSDHFFEAETELLEAFGDEARKCVY